VTKEPGFQGMHRLFEKNATGTWAQARNLSFKTPAASLSGPGLFYDPRTWHCEEGAVASRFERSKRPLLEEEQEFDLGFTSKTSSLGVSNEKAKRTFEIKRFHTSASDSHWLPH
jgi:hypothetical protein